MQRLLKTAAGSVLVLGGVAMLVLPGPGLVTIAAGTAVLGTEYAWARRIHDRIRALADRARSALIPTT